jgi:hypothetical protein
VCNIGAKRGKRRDTDHFAHIQENKLKENKKNYAPFLLEAAAA